MKETSRKFSLFSVRRTDGNQPLTPDSGETAVGKLVFLTSWEQEDSACSDTEREVNLTAGTFVFILPKQPKYHLHRRESSRHRPRLSWTNTQNQTHLFGSFCFFLASLYVYEAHSWRFSSPADEPVKRSSCSVWTHSKSLQPCFIMSSWGGHECLDHISSQSIQRLLKIFQISSCWWR